MNITLTCAERDITAALQQAIDTCFLSGGGEVCIPAGEYEIKTIRLRSNITLHLLENAHLFASRNCEDYAGFTDDTVEPLSEEDKKYAEYMFSLENRDYSFFNVPGSRWNRGIIKALDAENIEIHGEEGSFIDGRDCYDSLGEEGYRGPHAINLWRCKNIRLSGYEIRNSANWAHCIFESDGIFADRVTVRAGHDGIHMTGCDNIRITNCLFETGDDCVAGIDNEHVYVGNCIMNSSCSALRFGGSDVLIENCRMEGPGKYFFRGSLTEEEKKNGTVAKAEAGKHRNNMLTAFLYHADFSRTIRKPAENIVVRNCEFVNVDRFLEYNFSGSNIWQMNMPLKSITFENIRATGIKIPLVLYGDKEIPASLTVKDTTVRFADNTKNCFMHLCHYDTVKIQNVTAENVKSDVLIKKWSDDGKVIIENLSCPGFAGVTEKMAEEDFVCQWI